MSRSFPTLRITPVGMAVVVVALAATAAIAFIQEEITGYFRNDRRGSQLRPHRQADR